MIYLTVGRRFELYLDALGKCGKFLLDLCDDKIAYLVLDEFDIRATSFLHMNNLILFEEKGLIDSDITQKSTKLRENMLNMQEKNLWDVSSIRYSNEWRELMELCDEIKKLIAERWRESELEYIFANIN